MNLTKTENCQVCGFKLPKAKLNLGNHPLCDDLIKLSAMCMYKNNGTPSSFTKRIVNSDNQTLIGAKNTYITVCREGYFNTNE